MNYEVFNPRNHQEDVLNAFNRFTRKFGYVYDGENRAVPTTANTDELRAEWKDKDKARLFLSRAVSDEFLDDFESTVPAVERTDIKFTDLVTKMTTRYTPNTNKVRNHYVFHRLSQNSSESFDDFIHRMKSNAKHCDFKCDNAGCTVGDTLIRDQIITGTNNAAIRNEALKKQWTLDDLIKEGRVIESGAIAASELRKDASTFDVNRTKQGKNPSEKKGKGKFTCFKCEEDSCPGHNKCKFHNKQCPVCHKRGHSKKSRFCKGSKPPAPSDTMKKKKNTKTNRTEVASSEESSAYESSEDDDNTDDEKSVNMVRQSLQVLTVKVAGEHHTPPDLPIRSFSTNDTYHTNNVQHAKGSRKVSARRVGGRRHAPHKRRKIDFHTRVIVEGASIEVLVDTGADVNVMSKKTASKLGLKWSKNNTKLRPYGSKSLKVCGVYTGQIEFGDRSVEAEIFIVRLTLESLMSGITAEELGIISFHAVNRIEEEPDEEANQMPVSDDPVINSYLTKFHRRFKDIGKCDKVITLHQNENPKPFIQPQRPIPFHLRKRFDDECDEMIRQGIFEECEGPNEYISNPVIVPNGDDIRITVDYRNLNKSLLNSHHPIPRIDDLRASMNGCQYFTKLDLKKAYFQFPLSDESKPLTTFYANGRLLRLTRLPQGALPAASELNNALRQIFSAVPEASVIHDDIILATETVDQHYKVLEKVFILLEEHNLTLKGSKCIFLSQDIPFWGMRFTSQGIKPCPEKCKAIQEMSPPQRKEDVASFISLLQSHAKFIPMFSKLTYNIRALQKKRSKFCWKEVHQKEFDAVKEYFKESTTLSFFNPDLPTWIFVDAAKQGLSAVIAQGEDVDHTDVVAFASRTTTAVERRYPQIDLEAMAIDFGLRRFREYCVGGKDINVITDHKPLQPIFENKPRLGSIRIDRTKLRHQDIDYKVMWRPGKNNPADYLSRHPAKASQRQMNESREDAKLLYALHNDNFFMEEITPKRIVDETQKDVVLQAVIKHIRDGSKPTSPELSHYKNIFDELTVSDSGLLLRGHRVILPASLCIESIKKAYCRGHLGRSAFKRQMRNHFDFPNLDHLVETEVKNCNDCQLFTRKAVKNPLTPVYVPNSAWEYVSIDFFGPMPQGEHVLVVQDLCTKYPVAVLLSKGTHAKATINALDEIFTNFGRPTRYRSDNGPPFNSVEFTSYMENIGASRDPSYPYRPQSNPVETWMKPLGKCLKIANRNRKAKEQAIRDLLMAYRTTPHPATGLSPGEMLFRHGYRGAFPTRTKCSSSDFKKAVKKMKVDKDLRCAEINQSQKRKEFLSSKQVNRISLYLTNQHLHYLEVLMKL